jgi:ribonuclease P/MRP protein subunit POP5
MVRFKNRYIIAQVRTDQSSHVGAQPRITLKTLRAAIVDSVALNFGEFGLGVVSASLQVKFFSPQTSMFILRVCRDFCTQARAALTFLSDVGKLPVRVEVLHEAGSIRTCRTHGLRIYDRLLQGMVAERTPVSCRSAIASDAADPDRNFLATLRQ